MYCVLVIVKGKKDKYKAKLKAVKFCDFIRNFSGNNFI